MKMKLLAATVLASIGAVSCSDDKDVPAPAASAKVRSVEFTPMPAKMVNQDNIQFSDIFDTALKERLTPLINAQTGEVGYISGLPGLR